MSLITPSAPPMSFDPPSGGLRRRATAGVVKTGLSQGLRLLIQIGSVVVMSRLLAPSQFGLFAMAGPIVGFAALFQDLGLAQAIVQKRSLTQPEVSTLFWVSLGMSAGVACALLALSPLVALFYGEPRVGTLTAAMGVNVIIAGASSVPFALLNRRMQFGALALLDVASGAVSLALSATAAVLFHSYWALYVGSLVQTVIPAVGAWAATGWRPSLPARRSGAGVALHFGSNVTGFNVANFISRNFDNVLIARAWGDRPLGLYDRAYKLMLLPLQQINAPIAKVMLPVLSQTAHDPERYSRAYLQVQSQMLLITLPGIAFMVGAADVLVPLLLGDSFADSAPIFVALGLASFSQALNNSIGWLFVSQHRTQEYMFWGFFNSVVCVAGFVVGLPYGPVGVAAGYAAGELLRTPLSWWLVTRKGPVRAGPVFRMAYPHYVSGVAAFAAIAAVRTVLPPDPVLTLAACLCAAEATSFATLALFPQGRATMTRTLNLARSVLAKHVSGVEK
jgi:PST family polysaccharide transporter